MYICLSWLLSSQNFIGSWPGQGKETLFGQNSFGWKEYCKSCPQSERDLLVSKNWTLMQNIDQALAWVAPAALQWLFYVV